ncbi:hypothetical protein KCP73_04290 [Salmonella enterica subsp. enterica]|nr:hypothetical protein KCP73_04290 [Salmonella enterica subsp. enterica]
MSTGADVLAADGLGSRPVEELWQQWSTLLAARALDTTCYMIAAGGVVIVILVKRIVLSRSVGASRGGRSSRR